MKHESPSSAPGIGGRPIVVACVKPVPLAEPRVERGQLVTEGLAWGLPGSERRTLAAGKAAAQALGADLVALALGPAAAEAGLREALALGARRAVLVDAEGARLDALLTARVLAAAIRKLGQPKLVLTGGESADSQQGLLGPMVAEHLGLDLLAGAERLQGGGAGSSGSLTLQRAVEAQEERVQVQPPLVVTVSPAFSPAPHATSWGVGEAYDLPLATWPLRDLPLEGGHEPGSDLASLARAEQAKGEAERFEGDADEVAAQLVRRLRASGVVR